MLGKVKEIYEKHYKKLLAVTLTLFIVLMCTLVFWKINTGEFVSKDITLKGGLIITVQTQESLDVSKMQADLENNLGTSTTVRNIKAIDGSNLGYSFEVEKIDAEKAKSAVEQATGLKLTEGKYTIEEMSGALGSAFWSSAVKAIIIAFVFMAIVVFISFRVPVPSSAVVLCGICDVLETVAIMNLVGLKLSTAGVAALLMLIGYSVDTDILLSSRVLKRRDANTLAMTYSAIKTGTMTCGTSIAALAAIYIVSPAAVLKQIAAILLIGLILDMPNTWIQNAGILRWYLEKKSGATKT